MIKIYSFFTHFLFKNCIDINHFGFNGERFYWERSRHRLRRLMFINKDTYLVCERLNFTFVMNYKRFLEYYFGKRFLKKFTERYGFIQFERQNGIGNGL